MASCTRTAPAYRFRLADRDAWLRHLRSQGYVVVAGALSGEEVQTAKGMLWEDLQAAAGGKVAPRDPSTWSDWKLSPTGLVSGSVAQGAGSWYIRGAPGVKDVFATIWDDDNLIVSMDALIVWRPWWREAKWRPETEGLHLDQNPFDKPELDCVQGMIPLLAVTEGSGGLQVVPLTHTDEGRERIKKEFPHLAQKGDWCPLFRDLPGAKLLLAEPGDLILWDSRTVHGGLVGTGRGTAASDELARLAITVAMTPRARASEAVLVARRRGFEAGRNFNHCPHEAGSSSGTLSGKVSKDYVPLELTPEQRALL